jgi:stalled ribosome rescue protein Dom34
MEITMQSHYHAVVWIDHRQARIFHFDATDVDKLVIGPENPVRHLHHKADSNRGGHAAEDQKFLEEVAKSISDAGAILIVGPANEKNELVKHIKHSHPQITVRIEGVESADHPSDQELVAYARRYLKSADLMRPQI